jgi:hypothetical protein
MDLPNTIDKCQRQLKTLQAAIHMQMQDSIQLPLNEMKDQAKLAALDGKSTKTAKRKKMCNAKKTADMLCWIKVI